MAPKRGKEQPPDRSPTSPPEPSCRSSSIALRDSVADARTAKMSDRIPFRKSTTDRRGGQPWPGRAWTCWSRCATRRPGVTSTSCAKRSRYSAEAGKVRAKPQRQLLRGRAAEIMGRPLVEYPRGLRVSERRGFVRANDWAWMRSCGPTRWHALESSRVEHANDCVLASLDGRAGGRWDVARHTRTCLPEVRGGGRLHRHLGPARRSLQGR